MAAPKVITFFGSSAPREGSEHYTIAFECGRLLAEAGYTICNGGYAGTMEAGARGAKSAGGRTIGITIAGWPMNANRWIDQVIKARDLNERLMKLVELGEGYVVFRGGTGTLLEFSLVLELVNKNLIQPRPIVVLGDSWDGVVESLRQEPVSERQKDCTTLIHKVGTPKDLVRYFNGVFPSA